MSTRWRVVPALAVAVVAALSATTGFFFFRDNFSTHYPIKVLSAATLRTFEIPWWNFADSGGQPLAGNPNTLTFYPDNLLYLFLPAYVAFNLHFLIHLAVAYFAMRALTRSAFGGAMYALCGVAISATAFYNLIVAVAMIPLALFATHRRSPLLLGAAFGLMLLAAEPVTLIAAALSVAIAGAGRLRLRDFVKSIAVALVIGSPQIVAFLEIAREVERSVSMSAVATLAASMHPSRIVDIVWPFGHVLNEPGGDRIRLFSTIFTGVIVIPALITRSRYVAIAALMLFLALGRFNPLLLMSVEALPPLRIMRFPEKFVLPLVAALVVLSAAYFQRTRWKRTWALLTFLPLLLVAFRAVPIDWIAPYRVAPVSVTGRVHRPSTVTAGLVPARDEYRLRAKALEPLFGATAGLRYAMYPSPDRMHSLRTRMVVERMASASDRSRQRYLRINGCAVPGALPPAMFVRGVIPGRDIFEEVSIVESPQFDERTTVVSDRALPAAPGRVISYRQKGQTIEITVEAAGDATLFVNQTWFSAWRATSGREDLVTAPLDVDRLGIVVPPGRTTVTLQFGRNRLAVRVAWLLSTILLLALPFADRIEKLDRRTGEIERSGDHDGPLT